MQQSKAQLIIVLLFGTFIFLLLCAFIIILLLFFKQRQRQNLTEKADIHTAYEQAILQAQLETQNQMLQHVAEELHDHVGQMLAVVVLYLNVLHEETSETPYRERVAKLLTHTTMLVNDVRGLSKSLSTDTIARFGLVACLTLEIERINRADRAEQATLQVLGEPYQLGEQTEIVLLRMVQEALNNALKYAYDAAITLTLDYQPDALMLTVADEGPGFSMSEVDARPLTGSGQGLHNLRRRATLLGGTCTWQTAPQQGTRVTLWIPRKDKPVIDKSPTTN
ncbi:ATP-binding protein [Fibrella sp. HMF5335]|uniref:Oxygen sensor histidine kinase NreB n=1 Tax=Fibrella rubiginis TaxID=2817060 RepID=A0A939G9G4_9BACT|nr:ATP-binding protein [Fibrella rubiginis]MBO0934917.1 ATP-binding protein [Fibrella rubiginis]